MGNDGERGWVKPVEGDAAPEYMDPVEPQTRTARSSIVAGIVVVAIAVAAVAGTVIWRNRSGDPLASARSVPAEMDFVLTFDALALSDSERLQAFVDAFAVPMVEAGAIDSYPNDLVGAIDEAMMEDSGMTLTGDILPWIGRSVSIAATVPSVDMTTGEVGDLSLLVVADVRDRDAGEVFLDKVLNELAANDEEPIPASISGLAGYRWEDPVEDVTIGLVLTDDAFLLGVERDVAAAIEAHETGLSIADSAAFQDAMGRLPDERMASMYIASSAIDGLMDAATLGLPPQEAAFDEQLFDSAAAAFSLVDEGMLFSYVMVGAEEAVGAIAPDAAVLAGLPDETLGFISVAGSEAAALQTTDEEALAAVEDLLAGFAYETGIDLIGFIESLSGDFTVAAVETREGMIAAETEVPVGVVGAIGLLDSGPAGELLTMFEDMMLQQGATLENENGATTVIAEGEDIFSYAVADDLVVIGTGSELVGGAVSGSGGGLLDSGLYRELDAAVIGDGLLFYADIGRITGLIPLTTDEAAVFAPLRGVGFGGEAAGDVVEMEVMVLVDY